MVDRCKNRLYEGRQIVYYENGKIQLDVNSKNGKGDGECKRYDETGQLIADYILKDGIKVEDKLNMPLMH
jgi:antitoxin component YwqK of YwqJK toxin-antitoxin module